MYRTKMNTINIVVSGEPITVSFKKGWDGEITLECINSNGALVEISPQAILSHIDPSMEAVMKFAGERTNDQETLAFLKWINENWTKTETLEIKYNDQLVSVIFERNWSENTITYQVIGLEDKKDLTLSPEEIYQCFMSNKSKEEVVEIMQRYGENNTSEQDLSDFIKWLSERI